MISGEFQLALVVVVRRGECCFELFICLVDSRSFLPELDVVSKNSRGGDCSDSSIQGLLVNEGGFSGFSEGIGVGNALEDQLDGKRQIKEFCQAVVVLLLAVLVDL